MPRRLGALLLAAGCSGPTDPGDTGVAPDPIALLSEPGPFAVGFRLESVSWTESPLQADPRTLELAVWYPTDATTGAPVRYAGLLDAPDVLGDAPPAAGAHPLAVFSHGHMGYAENSSFLAEHFASHGWWVLAPDHLGNTTFDGGTRETSIYWQRPLDIAATLDHAEATLPLAGPVVAIGHSFGGYTVHALGGATYAIDAIQPACDDGTDTSEFCSTMTDAQADRFRAGFLDPRIDAVIAMAPGDWRLYGDGLAAIDRPELLMTGGLDPNPDSPLFWAGLDGAEDRWVQIPTAGHNAFTDLSGAIDPAGAIDPEEGFRIVRTYALAFARSRAEGDPVGEGLLDGTLALSPLAEVVTAHAATAR